MSPDAAISAVREDMERTPLGGGALLGMADQLLCEGPVGDTGLGFRGVLHHGEAPADRQVLVLQQPGHDFADVQRGGLSVWKKRGGEIGLGVEVHAKNPAAFLGQNVGQMLANCRFG